MFGCVLVGGRIIGDLDVSCVYARARGAVRLLAEMWPC